VERDIEPRAGPYLAPDVAVRHHRGVRYTWRHRDQVDYDTVRNVVLEHGGVVTERRRRVGIYALVAVVVLASFGAASLRGSIAAAAPRKNSPRRAT